MKGFEILQKDVLAPEIKRLIISAPLIAEKAKVGQFIILRMDERGERFPLTLVDWNPDKGSITIVVQEAGVSTKKLGRLEVGDSILDIVGPLGNPAEIKKFVTLKLHPTCKEDLNSEDYLIEVRAPMVAKKLLRNLWFFLYIQKEKGYQCQYKRLRMVRSLCS